MAEATNRSSAVPRPSHDPPPSGGRTNSSPTQELRYRPPQRGSFSAIATSAPSILPSPFKSSDRT